MGSTVLVYKKYNIIDKKTYVRKIATYRRFRLTIIYSPLNAHRSTLNVNRLHLFPRISHLLAQYSAENHLDILDEAVVAVVVAV